MSGETTDLIFILDRSGSMSGLEDDTIGGYNSLLDKQRQQEGDVHVTTVLFDNRYKMLHERIDIRELEHISRKDYYVRGSTALLDAVGKTINHIKGIQKDKNKTLVVIITDGMENASIEYTYRQIKELIELQKTTCGWEFIFLGANIDAVQEGKRFGINEDRSATYRSDAKGTALNFDTVSEATSELRMRGRINSKWKDLIEKDLSDRKV